MQTSGPLKPALLPEAHICLAVQHWAADFCPSVSLHRRKFKVISITAISSAAYSGEPICWTPCKSRNTNYVMPKQLHQCSRCVWSKKKKWTKKYGQSPDNSSSAPLETNYGCFSCFVGQTEQTDWISLHFYESNENTYIAISMIWGR